MEIKEFLSNHFSPIKHSGEQAQFLCPFHDDKYPGHLYMNIRTGMWCCFHGDCGQKGAFPKFLALTGLDAIGDTIYFEAPVHFKPRIQDLPHIKESYLAAYSMYPRSLLNQGFKFDLLKKKQVLVDTKNNRIIFPIRDYLGRLVGISGKAIGEGYPKYKIYKKELWEQYPNYEFDKRYHLYNMDEVFPELLFYKKDELIIVEGFKACLWMIQSDYSNTVAVMGSTLSKEQINFISGVADKVVLFLDNDAAGSSGTEVSGKILSKFCKVYVMLGDKKQPDDYTKDEIDKLYENKLGLTQYLIKRRYYGKKYV